jgi:chromosome segregation ATPase
MWRYNIRVHPLSRDMATLEEENNQLKSVVNSLHQQNFELVHENQGLREQNILLNAREILPENSLLREEIKAQNAYLTALKEEIKTQNGFLTVLKEVEALSRDEIASLKVSLQLYKVKLERSAKRHFRAQSEKADLNAHIFQLQKSLESLQDANSSKTVELHKLKKLANELKEYFTCSITQELMTEPCVLSSGHLYQRDDIIRWLWRSQTCPNSRMQVRQMDFNPQINPTLRSVCAIVAQMH